MSGWRLVVREIYEAGGSKPTNRLHSSAEGVEVARRMGLIERAGFRGSASWCAPATLSRKGIDFAENRLQKIDARLGRQWQATWLAALLRTNEVRLTGVVHRAQDDGTCYW